MREDTILKMRQLPEGLVEEVDDFVEFLLSKKTNGTRLSGTQPGQQLELLELDFADYLPNLEEYEAQLARGEVQW